MSDQKDSEQSRNKQKLLDMFLPVLQEVKEGKNIEKLEYSDDGFWGEDIFIIDQRGGKYTLDVTETTDFEMIERIMEFFRNNHTIICES